VVDDASDWYWLLVRTNNIATCIERRYSDTRCDYERIQDLSERRQMPGESLDSFFHAMRRLRAAVRLPITEKWMIKTVKRNLCEPLKQYVFPIRAYTLEHLRDECREAERAFAEEVGRARQTPRAVPPRRLEFRGQRVDEVQYSSIPDQNFRTVVEHENEGGLVEAIQSASQRKAVVCWNCKQAGHVYKQCETPQKSYFCFKCGRADTFTPKCPNCNPGNSKGNVINPVELRSGREPVGVTPMTQSRAK